MLYVIFSIGWSSFTKIGNNGNTNTIQINDIGSDKFNTTKMSNWHYDFRYPLIPPLRTGKYQNIYAPSIVNNGATNFNIYFGGWDGVNSPHDSVSITVTPNLFNTFNPHYPQIATGQFNELNNCNSIKVNDTFWVMLYTCLPNGSRKNKPGYATSKDGVSWTPNSGTPNYFISMSGYPYNWSNADVNGGNVIYYDDINDKYHLYFIDFAQENAHSVFHAVNNNNLKDWEFQNVALNEPHKVVNDMKRINGHYLMGLHYNTQHVWYSINDRNLTVFPESQVLFDNLGDDDKYITSMGWVVDEIGDRLMGALYGASNISALTQNAVFGIWLQKQVLFISDDNKTVWGIGDASRGYGPDNIMIDVNEKSLNGKFYLYDTDYVDVDNRGTLIEVSNDVVVNGGDIWQYSS